MINITFLKSRSLLNLKQAHRSAASNHRGDAALGSRVRTAGLAPATHAARAMRRATRLAMPCSAAMAAWRTLWAAAAGKTVRTSRYADCRRESRRRCSPGWASRAWRRRRRARRRWAGRLAQRARTQCGAAARPRAGGATTEHTRPTSLPYSA